MVVFTLVYFKVIELTSQDVLVRENISLLLYVGTFRVPSSAFHKKKKGFDPLIYLFDTNHRLFACAYGIVV